MPVILYTEHTPFSWVWVTRIMVQKTHLLSPVSWSVVTAAVRPTPEEPRPVVVMARGAVWSTYRSNWDLATDGSPISRMLISLEVIYSIEIHYRCLNTVSYILPEAWMYSLPKYMTVYCNLFQFFHPWLWKPCHFTKGKWATEDNDEHYSELWLGRRLD